MSSITQSDYYLADGYAVKNPDGCEHCQDCGHFSHECPTLPQITNAMEKTLADMGIDVESNEVSIRATRKMVRSLKKIVASK